MTTMTNWERELTLTDIALLLGAAMKEGRPRVEPITKEKLVETLYHFPELGISPSTAWASQLMMEYAVVRLWSKGYLMQTNTRDGTFYSISVVGKLALQKAKALVTDFHRTLMGV